MIKRILFILVLCLLVITPIVSAETLTGTLGGTSISNPQWTYVGDAQSGSGHNILILNTNDAEYTTGLKSLVHFSVWGAEVGGTRAGNTTRFIAKTGTHTWGSGTYGYQRVWNGATEIAGYQWWAFDSWNNTGQSGVKTITITLNDTIEAWGNGGKAAGSFTPATTGNIWIGGGDGKPARGNYLQLREITFYNTYIAEKPSGIGITGRINKTVNGQAYNSRVYITDGALNGIITSDTTTNSNDFLFGIVNQSIKINSLDSGGTWWNSTTLFGSTLPTVTPTPISTTTPADESNITIAVKYVTNDTAVSSAYVEMQGYYKSANKQGSYQQSLQGYTDSNGYFQSDLTDIKNFDWKVVVQKAGLQTNSEWLDNINPYTYSRIVYMYPDTSGSGGIPTTINYTLQIKNSQTGANVVGALVTLKDTISGTAQRSVFSNATGYAVFKGVPNTAYVDGSISATNYQTRSWSVEIDSITGTYIQSKDYARSLYISPVGVSPTGTVTPYPTPTPTPVTSDALILTATPDSINLGSSVSLTGSSSNATRLTYAGGLRRTSFYVNVHPNTYPFDYNMIGIFENVNATYWKFRANNSVAWNTPTTTSPLTLVNTPNANGLITYSFNAYDTNGAIATAGTDDVLVGGGAGSGALTIAVGAYDATTTGRLMGFSLNITDEGSGVVIEYGNINYMKEITLPRGNGYVLRATKEGYQTSTTIGESGTLLFIVPTSLSIQKGDYGAVFNVPMFPDGAITVGNTSISVRVFDIETYYPLSGVQVTNSYAPTDIKYTGEEDSLTWTMPQNTAYTLTASKSGYCTITQSKNTSTNTHQFVPLYLKYGSCSGATATPTPTPTITPTATPIGGWGNVTGGASVCGILPDDATIIDILKNSMACNGLKDTQSQNLGMSMLIILFAAIILGRIAKGVGVLAGAIIGTVISTVAGFLPFWIIIVVIIMAGLVFAGKVFWSSSQ